MTGYSLTRQWVLHSPDGTHALCGERKAQALAILHAVQPPVVRPRGRPKGPPKPEQPPRPRGRPPLPAGEKKPVGRPRKPEPPRDSRGLITWEATTPGGWIVTHITERADIAACVMLRTEIGGAWIPFFWGTRAAANGMLRFAQVPGREGAIVGVRCSAGTQS